MLKKPLHSPLFFPISFCKLIHFLKAILDVKDVR